MRRCEYFMRRWGFLTILAMASIPNPFFDAVGVLAGRLAGRMWLVGEAMTAADVTAAPVLYRVRQTGVFPMPPAAERIREWENRVLSFDRHIPRAGA